MRGYPFVRSPAEVKPTSIKAGGLVHRLDHGTRMTSVGFLHLPRALVGLGLAGPFGPLARATFLPSAQAPVGEATAGVPVMRGGTHREILPDQILF